MMIVHTESEVFQNVREIFWSEEKCCLVFHDGNQENVAEIKFKDMIFAKGTGVAANDNN